MCRSLPIRELPGQNRESHDNRASAVLLSSADLPFEGDEDTFDRTRADAALDFDRRERLELPALSSMLVEHLLNLVAGHLAADHALAELDHPVFVAVHHTRTIVCPVRLTNAGRNRRLPEGFALCPYGTLRTRRGYLTVRTEPLPLSSVDETRPAVPRGIPPHAAGNAESNS